MSTLLVVDEAISELQHQLKESRGRRASCEISYWALRGREPVGCWSKEGFDSAVLARFWLNQTSKFLLAYHRHGIFDRPEVKDVRQLVLDWQKDNNILLGRFRAVLQRIVDVVRDSDEQQLEVSWDGQWPLLITKQVGKGTRALPSDLCRLWDHAPDAKSS